MKPVITKIILCAVMAFVCLTANAQVKEFEKYSDTKNVTYVYISKFMLKLAGAKASPSLPGVNTKSLMDKLDAIQIISAEEKLAALKLKADTRDIVKRGKYGLLLQVNEDDEKVDIYYSVDKRHGIVVMLVEEDDEVNVIVFSGKFTLDDVLRMTK